MSTVNNDSRHDPTLRRGRVQPPRTPFQGHQWDAILLGTPLPNTFSYQLVPTQLCQFPMAQFSFSNV